MKLSMRQIEKIIKVKGNFLVESEFLPLLHEDIDVEILLLIIARVKFRTEYTEVTAQLLKEVFLEFPHLVVWLYLNKKDDLAKCIKVLKEYRDIYILLSLPFSGIDKLDSHIRSYLTTVFESILHNDALNVHTYLYSHYALNASNIAVLKNTHIFGNALSSKFKDPAMKVFFTDPILTVEEFLTEFRILKSAPLLILSDSMLQGNVGFTKEGGSGQRKAAFMTAAQISISAEELKTEVEVSNSCLDRMTDIASKVLVYLDLAAEEYLVACGVESSWITKPYTKYSTKVQIENTMSKHIAAYLDRTIGKVLAAEASSTSPSYFRGTGTTRDVVEYTVLHFKTKVMISI